MRQEARHNPIAGLGNRGRGRLAGRFALILAIWLAVTPLAPATATEPSEQEQQQLLALSLEELMDIEVYTASKKAERVSEVSAAIFVLTGEDIRRSGATSIPDALRMVPGLHVAQVDVHQWAISARGFQSEVADKLLVLIDGRTVYSPLFAGVFWDVQDTLLEDIDRIEVIRGPGATIWGSNAVNGVINIITRAAGKTEGGLVTVTSGNQESIGAVRYGAALGEKTSFRAFGKFFDRAQLPALGEVEPLEDWQTARGGFRLDRQLDGDSSLVFTGEAYDGAVGESLRSAQTAPPYVVVSPREREFSGGFLLGRWSHKTTAGDEISLQGYFDQVDFDSAIGKYTRDTLDFEFQHSLRLGRTDTIWGLSYRLNKDDTVNTGSVIFTPPTSSQSLWSAFIQAEVPFAERKGAVTLGSKFEHNEYSGLEIQPTVRFRWAPDPRRTYWAAISRAVQTPARVFSEVRYNEQAGPLPQPIQVPFVGQVDTFLAALVPGTDLESEELLAYEFGIRLQPSESLYLSAAAFLNNYDKIKARVAQAPTIEFDQFGPHLLLGFETANGVRGDTRGVEIVVDWAPADNWKLQTWYSYLDMDFEPLLQGAAREALENSGSAPEHQASLRSSWDLGPQWETDLWLRYVDEVTTRAADSYVEMDLRIGLQLSDRIDFSLVGRNLLDDEHSEFAVLFAPGVPSNVERTLHGVLTWKF